MPDRVIDAPIPEDLREDYEFSRDREPCELKELHKTIVALIERIARLEAEKQEARTEGWNAAIESIAELCLEWVDSTSCEPGTACKCQRTADSIRHRTFGLSKPTAAKQGDPS